MRVLHVIPSLAARYGGPSAAVRGMAAAQARAGARVTVAATDGDGPGRERVPLDRPVAVDGVEYRFFARSLPGEYKFSWPLTRWLARGARDFDVVHVHALFSYSTIPACRAARRSGVPYVLRPLGTLGGWSLAHRAWKKAPYLALVERRHLRDAGAIHVTSDAEAEAVAALGYGAKTRVIPLGVASVGDELVEARTAAAAQRAAQPGAPLRLLFLSRLHPVKGLPLLFEALAAVRSQVNVELTVAGDGPAYYVDELRAAVAAAGLTDRVRFVGHLAGDAKAAALDDADLFVLPSSHENFGISAAESLARGLPALLTEGVGIAQDVARAGAGMVVPPVAASLAAAIDRVATERALLAPMGRAAVALARREYSWTAAAERLLNLYAELAPPRRRAASVGDRSLVAERT
jgi:glycosyltransferase involved in cell wall biosynthesis